MQKKHTDTTLVVHVEIGESNGTNEMAILEEKEEKNFFRSLNDGLGFIVDVITAMLCNAYHIYLIFRVVKVARSAKIAFHKIRKFSVVYVSTYCCTVHCT